MWRLAELLPVIAPNVQALDMMKCGLGDAGAQALASAVQRLPRLRRLFLVTNTIGPRGRQSLQRAWQGRPESYTNGGLGGLLVTILDPLRLWLNLWEFIGLMPVYRTRKEVQAARTWPAATDQRLVELAGEGPGSKPSF